MSAAPPEAGWDDEKDALAVAFQMHRNWVVREEQFRVCVHQLEAIAEQGAAENRKKDAEIAALASKVAALERELQGEGAPTDAEADAAEANSAAPPQTEALDLMGDIAAGEAHKTVREILLYLDCSFDECQRTLCEVNDVAQQEAEDSEDADVILASIMAEYAAKVVLPLAYHIISRAMGRDELASPGIRIWHDCVVRPIRGVAVTAESLALLVDRLHDASAEASTEAARPQFQLFNSWQTLSAATAQRMRAQMAGEQAPFSRTCGTNSDDASDRHEPEGSAVATSTQAGATAGGEDGDASSPTTHPALHVPSHSRGAVHLGTPSPYSTLASSTGAMALSPRSIEDLSARRQTDYNQLLANNASSQ